MLAKLDAINLLAGFVLGLLPILLPAAARLFRHLRSGARTKYIGRFRLYHWSASRDLIRTKELRFSLSVAGQIKVRGARDPITGLSYRGLLQKGETGVIYLDITADEDGGRLLFVLNNPVVPHFELTTGLFCAIDLQGTPTAWRCVLSRKPLSEELVQLYLGPRELLHGSRAPALASVESTQSPVS